MFHTLPVHLKLQCCAGVCVADWVPLTMYGGDEGLPRRLCVWLAGFSSAPMLEGLATHGRNPWERPPPAKLLLFTILSALGFAHFKCPSLETIHFATSVCSRGLWQDFKGAMVRT